MQFLKKNYDKILLGLVLAGLIGVLVFMLFYISADEASMKNQANIYINPKVERLQDLDLGPENGIIARLQAPYSLDLDNTNKLFNPMEWQRDLNGNLVPKSNLGPEFVVVTNIQPLYLTVSLDSVDPTEFGPRYVVGVEKQGDKNPARRHKQQHWVSVGDKNESFSVVSITGAPENPDALVLKLTDTGETVSVRLGKPYREVDGYVADFVYNPEKKVFLGRRVGDKVSFGGGDYEIMDITADELILSDESNQKKTSLRFSP